MRNGVRMNQLRRANKAHDADLLAARVDREPDGVVDEDQADDAKQHDEDDTHRAQHPREGEELVDDLLTVLERLLRIVRPVGNLAAKSGSP